MFECPHCRARTVSPLKKLLRGPMFSERCRACRKHWGVSRLSIVAAVATLAGYFAFLLVVRPTPLHGQIAMAVAFILLALILLFVVPVVRK